MNQSTMFPKVLKSPDWRVLDKSMTSNIGSVGRPHYQGAMVSLVDDWSDIAEPLEHFLNA